MSNANYGELPVYLMEKIAFQNLIVHHIKIKQHVEMRALMELAFMLFLLEQIQELVDYNYVQMQQLI